jgi:hypothetical protein
MENGALILFSGGVEMTVNPDQARQNSAPVSAPAR